MRRRFRLALALLLTGSFVACGSSAADLDKRLRLHDEAFLCELRGDWLCAAERYRASLQMQADDLPTLHRYARARASMGDYAGAAEIIDRIERQIPGGAIAPLLRADLGPFLGDEQALHHASLALERAPQSAAGHYYRGNLRARLGDWNGAIQDYGRAEQLWPEYTPAKINRALASLLHPGGRADYVAAILTAAINADAEREQAQGVPLYIQRYGAAFQPFVERARLRLRVGDHDGGCADLTAAVARGYIGDPLGCTILLSPSETTRLTAL